MAKQSDQPGTLPQPELNPLVNPLLAENMGRWAEVYFTSPPEKREEAVLELLRELEAKNAQTDGPVATPSAPANPSGLQRVPMPERSSTVPNYADTIRCQSCGRENPSSHRFCGMCGTNLHPEDGFDHRDSSAPFDSEGNRSALDWDRHSDEVNDDRDSRPTEHLPVATSEFSLFQTPREGYDEAAWDEDDAPSSPYRLYVGIVLALLIVGLSYMAWRSMQATSHSLPVAAPPAAAPAPESSASQAGTPASTPNPTSSDQAAAGNATNSSTPAATEPSEPKSAKASENAKPSIPTGSQPSKPKPAKAETQAAAQSERQQESPSADNGSEELAVARRFLAGSNGTRGDPGEAAKWLWKSIAKHNSDATVLLADLYLKGSGVPKNCDQARVLLYSAARKGTPGAGERLRNLQAFGCQ